MQNFRHFDESKKLSYDCPELHSCFYISLNNEINSCMLCRGHLDYKDLQIASIANIDNENVEQLYKKIVAHQMICWNECTSVMCRSFVKDATT